jgi:hypothetical protein
VHTSFNAAAGAGNAHIFLFFPLLVVQLERSGGKFSIFSGLESCEKFVENYKCFSFHKVITNI